MELIESKKKFTSSEERPSSVLFPTKLSITYEGHTNKVRCITVQNLGQYIASGSDDTTIKIWEIATGRCTQTIPCGGVVRSIAWYPNGKALSLLLVAVDRQILLINPNVGDYLIRNITDEFLTRIPERDIIVNERDHTSVQWEQAKGENQQKHIRVIINHSEIITQVIWHGAKNYFITITINGEVFINNLSEGHTYLLHDLKGIVKCLFHPVNTLLYVATNKDVIAYELEKACPVVKQIFSKLDCAITTIAIYSGGDSLLIATDDGKASWYNISTEKSHSLQLHRSGVQNIIFHKTYPLILASSATDDFVTCTKGIINLGMDEENLLSLKLNEVAAEKPNGYKIMDAIFHPTQPWVFTADIEGKISLYS